MQMRTQFSIVCRTTVKSLVLCLVLLTPVSSLAVGQVMVLGLFKDRAVLEIDGARRVLSAGEVSPEGVLLVSADSREAVLEIDGKRSVHSLGSRVGGYFSQPEQRTVEIWATGNGMYLTLGSINNSTVRFLVDTGATTVAMNEHHARRLGIDFRFTGKPVMVSTASGIARAYQVKLRTVKVGEIALSNVDAVVIEGGSPTEVLLGMSFLNRVEMENDGRMLRLRTKY